MNKRQLATNIVRTLKQKGYEAYFVGGCVRDMLRKEKPSDYDVATNATPNDIEKIFKKTVPVGKAFGVMIVLIDGTSFEVATFRKDLKYQDGRRPKGVKFSDAKEDCLRRDFTVNGLFYDPVAKKVIDWDGGKADLKKKVIRTIGDPKKRFKEDKLRMLRAIRFAANLGFKLHGPTLTSIKKMHKDIRVVSAERVRDELIKLFTGPNPDVGLELLDKSGLLKEILPELDKLKGVKQPKEYHPEGDVWEHTKLILKHIRKPDVVLAFGALLHDIGKPKTFKKAKDRIRFNGHDRVGARMSEKTLDRLRFPNDTKKKIVACVEWHMQFKDAKHMRQSTLKKMMQRETFLIELEQHRADCLASHKNLSIWRFLKKKIKTMKEDDIRPELFLRGKDLISMGMKPGPHVGKVLKEAEEKQLEGIFKTKQQALKWAKKFLKT